MMNTELVINSEALQGFCEARTNSKTATVTEQQETAIKTALRACKGVFSGWLPDLGWIYTFEDKEPDAFILDSPAGLILAVSTAFSDLGQVEQRIIVNCAIEDYFTEGPFSAVDVAALKE